MSKVLTIYGAWDGEECATKYFLSKDSAIKQAQEYILKAGEIYNLSEEIIEQLNKGIIENGEARYDKTWQGQSINVIVAAVDEVGVFE